MPTSLPQDIQTIYNDHLSSNSKVIRNTENQTSIYHDDEHIPIIHADHIQIYQHKNEKESDEKGKKFRLRKE